MNLKHGHAEGFAGMSWIAKAIIKLKVFVIYMHLLYLRVPSDSPQDTVLRHRHRRGEIRSHARRTRAYSLENDARAVLVLKEVSRALAECLVQ